jgi:hypothetical protein
MKRNWWLPLVLMLAGCATAQPREVKQGPSSQGIGSEFAGTENVASASSPKAHQPDDDDQDRLRGQEIRRHVEARQAHEGDENYHPPADLSGLYAGSTTPDLKTVLARHHEILLKRYGIRDFAMRTPVQTEVGDVAGQRLFDELMEVERELWSRWKAGDESAKLPEYAQ